MVDSWLPERQPTAVPSWEGHVSPPPSLSLYIPLICVSSSSWLSQLLHVVKYWLRLVNGYFPSNLRVSHKTTWNGLQSYLNALGNFLKHPWTFPKTSLEHSQNFLETPFKLPWNLLVTPLKLPWNILETSLKHPWNFLKTHLKLHTPF